MKSFITKTLLFLFLSSIAFAQDATSTEEQKDCLIFRANAEIGFLAAVDHKIQFSNDGTYFDYVEDGGQDVLFPVTRLSLELQKNKNTFVFLYQPLRIESTVLLQEDLIVDDLTYPAGTGVNLLYSFPFYRVSYLRELLKNPGKNSFALGFTLQIRNATISFESTDGTRYRTNRDVGPVPALKVRARKQLTDRIYTELEADGIYAPVSYLNGSDNEVVGAILDASLRTGLKLIDPVDAYLNFRYLGGGAVGTSEVDGPGDGYVRNWLHFTTFTGGFVYTFL